MREGRSASGKCYPGARGQSRVAVQGLRTPWICRWAALLKQDKRSSCCGYERAWKWALLSCCQTWWAGNDDHKTSRCIMKLTSNNRDHIAQTESHKELPTRGFITCHRIQPLGRLSQELGDTSYNAAKDGLRGREWGMLLQKRTGNLWCVYLVKLLPFCSLLAGDCPSRELPEICAVFFFLFYGCCFSWWVTNGMRP